MMSQKRDATVDPKLLRAVCEALQPERDGSMWEACGCQRLINRTFADGSPRPQNDNHPVCHGTGRVPVADLDALLVAAREAGYRLTVQAAYTEPWACLMRGEDGNLIGDLHWTTSPTAAVVAALAKALGLDKGES